MRTARRIVLAIAIAIALTVTGPLAAQDYAGAIASMTIASAKLDAPPDSYTFHEELLSVDVSPGELDLTYRGRGLKVCRAVMAMGIYTVVSRVGSGTWNIHARCVGNNVDGLVRLDSSPPFYAVTQYAGGRKVYSTTWTGGD